MKNKELLFSVTAADCEFEFFRASGAGGQHRDKTSSACRCRHRASGAVGEARDAREQTVNKRNAFLRMAETKEFKTWHRLEAARIACRAKSIEEMVDEAVEEAMLPHKVKIEIADEEGVWVERRDL